MGSITVFTFNTSSIAFALRNNAGVLILQQEYAGLVTTTRGRLTMI